ncbi:retrotransposon protein, putative, ty1-copia subclass [Tanacetum coccineum]
MTAELHRQFKNSSSYDMIKELKAMFEKQAGVERFDLIQTFYACKQEQGKPVAAYVIQMKGYVDQLERLGYVLPQDVVVGLILNGLTTDFYGFVRNYNMHNMGKTVGELHAMLIKTPEANKKSLKAKGKGKANGKGKDKQVYIPKPKTLNLLLKSTQLRMTPATTARSRYGYVYLLKHKHEVFETFKVFKNEVENQLGKTIKDLRSDRGGEYISQEFKDYLKACGIVQQLTPPYTPQHNDVSERRNRTLLDMGCEALVKRDTPDKLQQRSVKCIFIGYPKETMGYYFYFPPENKIVVARYAEFFEKNLITQEVSGRAIDLEEIQDEDTSPSEITSEILWSYKRALLDSESNKWIDAMNAEIQSMMDNMVWVLVDLPPGCKTVGRFGKASIYLGIKSTGDRSKRLIGLGQNAYMDKILKRYRMDNSKRGHIPMQERLDLNKAQGASTPKEVKRMKNIPYASVVGSIMYAVRCTRPHVAFAQNITSRFQQNPGELHWTAVKNILKYLRNTKDMFLIRKLNFELIAIAMLAEYIAASEAAMEAVWIRKFISGLGIVPIINKPIRMFCDNSTALHFANESGVQRGARHYHRRYHYVRECIALGEIRLLKSSHR